MNPARIFFTALSWLPLPFVHRLGDLLGRSLMWFNNSLRATATTNVQHCFPDWSQQKQQQLVMQCLQETAKAVLESGALWLWPVARVLPLVHEVSGEDLLKEAMAKGKGVIVAAPHLGAWEIIGVYCSRLCPMTNLYRPPRQPMLNDLMRQARERTGATVVPTNASGVRSLYKALGRGELVGILPDQDPGRTAGVFAPFFGIQANTMTLLSRLASKTGATVLTVFAERLPNGQGYHLQFKQTDFELVEGDDIQKATHLNQAVEQCVLQQPGQYQWTYKRFKTRPKGEDRFY